MTSVEHTARVDLAIGPDEVVLTLNGELDAAARMQLRLLVRRLLRRRPDRVAVDVSRVTRIDAAGLGALLRADLLLRSVGSSLFVVHPSAEFLGKLRATGLERRLAVAR